MQLGAIIIPLVCFPGGLDLQLAWFFPWNLILYKGRYKLSNAVRPASHAAPRGMSKPGSSSRRLPFCVFKNLYVSSLERTNARGAGFPRASFAKDAPGPLQLSLALSPLCSSCLNPTPSDARDAQKPTKPSYLSRPIAVVLKYNVFRQPPKR